MYQQPSSCEMGLWFFYNHLCFFPSLENFLFFIRLLFSHLRRSPQISCSPRSGTEPCSARHYPPLLPSTPPPPPPPSFPSHPPPSNVLSFFSLTHMPPAASVTHSQSVFWIQTQPRCKIALLQIFQAVISNLPSRNIQLSTTWILIFAGEFNSWKHKWN